MTVESLLEPCIYDEKYLLEWWKMLHHDLLDQISDQLKEVLVSATENSLKEEAIAMILVVMKEEEAKDVRYSEV